MPVDRLDDRAQRAVNRARRAAEELHHQQVGTEHLLLGLVADGDSDAGRALHACGVTFEACRAKVAEAVANKRQGSPAPGLGFTDRAKLTLERAGRMSLRERCDRAGTRHVLLSLLDVEGTAGQVLRGMAVDPGRVRQEVERTTPVGSRGPGGSAGPEGAEEAGDPRYGGGPGYGGPLTGPHCPGCAAPLTAVLAHRGAGSRGPDGSVTQVTLVYCSACGSTIGVVA